ncbi:TetR/AcrR family transcriptional regulator [Saccharothrix sp. Mg75]|uniref:TetR/AcrR family transcriptional regulator n=1 Tax=Saccharothrix sp. Mg75 TaxID=3445357 RepID=UPI003EEF705F
MSATDDVRRRGLELLWKDAERPARGPQRGLTLERIVSTAIELVETEGVAALSMRRVAQDLGVGPASLYTYLPGKAELAALMLDAVAFDETLPHEWPGDWRAKIEGWARSDWEGYRRHPWVLHFVSVVPLPGPNLLRWMDSGLRVFDDTGLGEAEKMAVVESVDAYVRGQARLSLEGRDPDDGDEVRARNAALRDLVDFTPYPALVRALQAGVSPYQGQKFEFGLRLLLDGVEALIASRG